MKNLCLSLILLSLAWFTFSCSDDDPMPDEAESYADLESEWIRLAVVTGNNQISIMNPISGETTFEVSSSLTEAARYYPSGTGRYLVSVE
ncbi:MAG: hypothetical protein ACFB15_12925 [Cyclobacteriaceae bacterium]